MKKGLIVKIILGLVLIVMLLFLGYKIITSLTEIIVNMLDNPVIEDEYDDYQLYTPEPMPTMPAYMGEDSFYDNAEDVVVEGE